MTQFLDWLLSLFTRSVSAPSKEEQDKAAKEYAEDLLDAKFGKKK